MRRGNTPSACPGLPHHVSSTPERHAYYDAWRRCTNPRTKEYPDYGARGIRFLFTSFDTFLTEVGPRPSPQHCLDRINNDGHYEPGNVRWVSLSISKWNQRKRKGGTSQYRGVSALRGKWQAEIIIPNSCGKGRGNQLYLGIFSTEIEAARAYERKAIELGLDVILNFSL